MKLNNINYQSVLIITHVAWKKVPSHTTIEGPYSSVCEVFKKLDIDVSTIQVPLQDYKDPIVIGKWKNDKKKFIPKIFGFNVLKYISDLIIISFYTFIFLLKNKTESKIIIGIDPLSCLSLVLFRKIYKFTLIFYCVDFNEQRFSNSILQKLYEKCDEICSKQSDQTWVICEALKIQKKAKYKVEAVYIPNSTLFDISLYEKGKSNRTGNKLVWTGSCITERQFDILFNVLNHIHKLIPNLEFYFAPTINFEKFEEYCIKYKFDNSKVLKLNSRREWQKFASKCDIGIALYDDKFGSTKYIEPMKIWDFMLCGLPFIISCEPSIAKQIKNSKIAYILNPGNHIPNEESLKLFCKRDNINSLQQTCIKFAKKFDIEKTISRTINKLKLN